MSKNISDDVLITPLQYDIIANISGSLIGLLIFKKWKGGPKSAIG